ncbi:MAG: M48 family metalloprotease [Armatimonadetes bacterium]|nr:M48 family metalloprotease [Armatimonadota bacterium]
MQTRFLCVSLLFVGLIGGSQAQSLKPDFKTQLKLGKEAAAELRKKEKVLPASDQRVKHLTMLGSKIIATIPASELKARPYEFTFEVIESKEINAFALPGGPVFFYTGLLEKLKTTDELLGILGHELTHVRGEHWAKMVEDQQGKGLLVGVLSEIFKVGRTGRTVANIALTLDGLKYSRNYEYAADKGGFDIESRLGYNPQGMANVFQMFLDLKGKGGDPEILKTHPDDKKRIQRIQDMIKKSGKTFPAEVRLPWVTNERLK